ncbi:hypothetical protein WMY93_012860 [Mugilogobius chulae]|uniref:Uncharacterized protein n=1 Tax=Mugilogobius chulae TaxID=88201 RepID=A0AAW0P1W3_9GOBI
MEAGALLFLLISSVFVQSSRAVDFYGHSATFLPTQRNADGTLPLSLISRENGRASCASQVTYSCSGDQCGTFNKGVAVETTKDGTGNNRWCQTEQEITTELTAEAKSVSLRQITFSQVCD